MAATVHPLDDAFERRGRSTGKRGPKSRGDEYTEDNYSVDHFYVKSTDGRGHGEKMALTIPPETLGQLGSIVESKRFPYKTIHDMVRDAIMHRLHALNDLQLDETLAEFLSQQRLLHALDLQRSMIENAKRAIETTRQHLELAMAERDWQLVVNAVIMADKTVQGMRKPYSDDLQMVIDRCVREVPRGWLRELIDAGVVRESDK